MDSAGSSFSGVQPYGAQQQSSQLGAIQGLGAASLDPNSQYAGALAQLTGTPNTGNPTASPNSAPSASSNNSSIQSLMSQIMSLLGTPSGG